MLEVATPYKLGFNHGELFGKKNPFTKGSSEFTKYEEGYSAGLSASMKTLPGEAVFWGTLIILARFASQFGLAVQIVMLTFIPWMFVAWILSEILFYWTFGGMFRAYIRKQKGEQ